MKHCRYCDRWLLLADFGIRRASPDGLSYKCRSCSSAYGHQHYSRGPEAAKVRAWIWAQANPERRLEIRRKSADKHRLKKQAASREYQRRVRLENPERAKRLGLIAAHIRRARLSGAGELSERAVEITLAVSRGICPYCGERRPITLDHLTPIAAGGSNAWDNLIGCCKSCNCSKHTKDVGDWLFEHHGVEGLARALIAIKAQRKAVRRLEPKLFEALYGRKIVLT